MSKGDAINKEWAEEGVAARYARAENATRPFAEIMIDESKLKESKSTDQVRILDIATGTGVVVAALQDALTTEQLKNVEIVAGDISDSMLAWVKERGTKEGWKNVDARKIDAANVNTEETFTHIFSNFAVFALPPTTLSTIFSLLRPGGFSAVSTWVHFAWYDHLARAVARLPDAPPMPTYEAVAGRINNGLPWYSADYVRENVKKAGFDKVELVQQKQRVDCGTPADYVDVMGIPTQMVAAQWDEGRRAELLEKVKVELKNVVEELVGEDGKIYLEMEGIVAWGWKA